MASSFSETEQNEIVYRYIKKEDFSEILAHLEKTFYLEEPVNRMLGTSEDRISDHHTRYTNMLNRYPKNICALAYTGSTVSQAQVAGVLIIHIHDVHNPLPTFNPRSLITSRYLDFLEQAESKYNIHKNHGLSAFPELAILSTDKKFRGRGIATELYKRAIAQLFQEGYPLVYSEFSNPISRKVGEKLGFKEVARFYFAEFKSKYEPREVPKDFENEYVSMMILENKCTQK